ncbi:GNAT family N-acetyltransferase [Sphingomonas sp. BN140010]|uniref:GNAT family N-acetyltransferase n=1 Tax=Sphingomonas arvum TaxID=2992113 RepID=A0ABT3JGM6_9SPHN|nr:GNAT family N-acetyltransferase [Sphingomonas sp. BN140010]MCW3798094.1 GNAT family N-acetyltransferase [Sphingomonas sp. BN140010]
MTIRPATAADLPAIDRVFRTSFCDTFAHLYAPEDLASFLGQFTPGAWQREFDDPAFAFQVGGQDGDVVGYAKLGPVKLPHVDPEGAIELKQLYLLGQAHGTGLARQLMEWVLDEARRRGAKRIALSVWEDNRRAQAFYRRYGFEDRGPYAFMVGNQADCDRVWEANL